MSEEINFTTLANFFPRQLEALKATKKFKFVLYGGSVGSGKSYFLRWALIFWLLEWGRKFKGVRVGLFCEDYPALNDRHLSKIKTEFPSWLGKFNDQRHEFTLASEYGSGVLAFRNLDDPSRYLSVEFAAEAVDEINRNPISTFTLLRTRLRWPEIAEVKFICACNPMGEAWVKNYFVKRLYPPEEKETQEFFFVRALPTDNAYLPPEYFKSLESLPEAERKAYLEGDWDAFQDMMDEGGWLRLLTDPELERSRMRIANHAGYNILGIDPAAGGDNSAIVLKSETCQEIVFNQKLNDVMDLAGVASDLYRRLNCHAAVVDKTGVGQGVYDRLRELGLQTTGVSFGSKPEDGMFSNLKAELYWKERGWLLGGGRLLENDGWNEFEIVKYKNKDGKITIQPKEDLFRKNLPSPNCVDAAVLTMAVDRRMIRNREILRARGGKFNDKIIEIWQGR